MRQHLLLRAAQQQGVAALHLRALLETDWLDRFLFPILQPITDDEIHATVQRAVAALMAAYGPVKA